jgi:hypothetical protein
MTGLRTVFRGGGVEGLEVREESVDRDNEPERERVGMVGHSTGGVKGWKEIVEGKYSKSTFLEKICEKFGDSGGVMGVLTLAASRGGMEMLIDKVRRGRTLGDDSGVMGAEQHAPLTALDEGLFNRLVSCLRMTCSNVSTVSCRRWISS